MNLSNQYNMLIKTAMLFAMLLASGVTTESRSSAQEAQAFRWELQPDENLVVTLEQSTGINTNVGPRSQQIGNTMLLKMDWKVLSADEDQFQITQTITRVKLTINAPGKSGVQITSIDTDSDAKTTELGETLLKQIQPLLGTKFNVTMSSRGAMTDVSIPKESLEILRLAPSSMPIRELLTEEGLKDLFGQSAIVFPEEPIAKDTTWEANQQNTTSGISKSNTVTYLGSTKNQDNNVHEFKLKSTVVDQKADNKKVDDTGVSEMSIEEFTGGGKILFSAQGATIVDSDLKNRMVTKRSYREKTIRTVVKTDVKMKVSRKK